MFSGIATIVTTMAQPGIIFPSFEYDSNHPHVAKCELNTATGHTISAHIEVQHAPTAHDVEIIALAVHRQALRRLECIYGILGGNSEVKIRNLRSETNPDEDILVAKGCIATAAVGTVSVIVGRSPEELRQLLERPWFEADIYFELFNQAKTAASHVVEFLGYYQIISAILGDNQSKIDSFILEHQPGTTQTLKPVGPTGTYETVYTRLRNEISHVRRVPGTSSPINLSKTKAEIAEHVSGLKHLATIAIKTLL